MKILKNYNVMTKYGLLQLVEDSDPLIPDLVLAEIKDELIREGVIEAEAPAEEEVPNE